MKMGIQLVAGGLLWGVFSYGLEVVKELDYQAHFIGVVANLDKLIRAGV